jgi:Carboxypeptidase regulatory-like domain
MTRALQAALVFMWLAGQWTMAQVTGWIQGKVTDASGAAVLGAVVTVEAADGSRRTTVTDGEGAFQISSLTLGNYNVKISANDLSDWSAANVPASVIPGSNPLVAVLQVAPTATTVTVGLPPEEVAAEQVSQELKQRALGVIPNYYVTYENHPAPLSARQKVRLGLKTLTDPTTFALAGVTAGLQQKTNSYYQYGQGTEGFAKRYGATYGTAANSILITEVLMDSVLHQDPRYFYSGQGTRAQRAWYAVEAAFRTKGDNGKWQPPYSDLVGLIASAEISQTYYPGSRTQYTLLGRGLMFRFAGRVALNLAQELLLKKVTSNAPAVQSAANVPVLHEGTPVPLIAVDGLNAEGATTGKTISFVLTQDLTVDGKVVAKTGDVALGQVGQVSPGKAPDEASNVALERVTLRAGDVNVPLRSSQVRGAVGPMQYKQLPDSGKIAVTLYVAQSVHFPEGQ